MTMTDEQLLALIDKICRNQEIQSQERRRDIHRFLIECQRLPGLQKSSHPLYLEAVDKTLEWISNNICTFKPQPELSIQMSLLRWINGYLTWRIRDLYLKQISQHRNEFSLDIPINDNSENSSTLLEQMSDNDFETPTLSGIDGYIERLRNQKVQEAFTQLERYVEEDPDQLFQNCHPRQYPYCNCQLLCQRLLFKNPPEKLTHISRQLDIKYDTLRSHWQRKCLPLLQNKLKELGYSGDEEL